MFSFFYLSSMLADKSFPEIKKESGCMHYEYLLIDMDHTIFDYEASERDGLIQACEAAGISWEESLLGIYQKVNSAIWKEFHENKISQEELKIERFRRFLTQAGLQADASIMKDTYTDAFSSGGHMLPHALDFLNYVKDLGYSLAVLTNGLTEMQYKRIEVAGIGHFFKSIIISEEVGLKKPDPEIYRLTHESLGDAGKEKLLMIGDSTITDIPGAAAYGIDSLLLADAHGDSLESTEATYIVSDIRGALELFKTWHQEA
jgi:2-haloacid dehalogenase